MAISSENDQVLSDDDRAVAVSSAGTLSDHDVGIVLQGL